MDREDVFIASPIIGDLQGVLHSSIFFNAIGDCVELGSIPRLGSYNHIVRAAAENMQKSRMSLHKPVLR